MATPERALTTGSADLRDDAGLAHAAKPSLVRGESSGNPALASEALAGAAAGNPYEVVLAEWLLWQCRMIAGVVTGTIFLNVGPDRPPLRIARWPEDAEEPPDLKRIAAATLTDKTPGLKMYAESDDTGGRQFLVCPVFVDGTPAAAVALVVTARSDLQQRAVLQLLQWGSVWLERLLGRAGTTPREGAALDMAAALLATRTYQDAAQEAADRLAHAFACERVSIGHRAGLRVQLAALSKAKQVGRKTPLGSDIEAAMEEALDRGDLVAIPASGSAEVSGLFCHAKLVHQYGLGAVCTLPISDGKALWGAITLERDRSWAEFTREQLQASVQLIGPILALKRREDRSLFAKAREALLAQAARLVGSGQLRVKITVLALLAFGGLSTVVPGDYRVAAPANVEGTVQRVIAAPFTGHLAASHARAGDAVRTGELLAALDRRELELEHDKLASEREKHVKEHYQALAERNRVQVNVLAARTAQTDAQIRLLEEQLERAQLRAPFDGVVVKGDLSQSLGAPVERGAVLFEVAPLNDYRLIIEVDEHEIAAIRSDQAGYFWPTGFPDAPLSLRIERIVPVAVAADGRNFFRVEARLLNPPPALRLGMQGIAKIGVGRRPWSWIWTHTLVNRVRLWVWSIGW